MDSSLLYTTWLVYMSIIGRVGIEITIRKKSQKMKTGNVIEMALASFKMSYLSKEILIFA